MRQRLQRAQEEAVALTCSCGHCGTKPWPELEVRMVRVPGIHLVGDTPAAHGVTFRIDRVLADGKMEVTPEGGKSLTVTASHFAPGPFPWSQEPPKSHDVAASRASQALAKKPVECQLESLEVESSVCTTQLESSSETLRSSTSVSSLFLPSRDLPLARAREPLQKLQVGREVRGRVVRHLDIGFFLDVGCTCQGLLRRRQARGLELKLGDCVKAFVASTEPEKWRLDLVLRPPASQVELDSWQEAGTEVTGVVVGIQAYGIFVDIGAAEAGLVHVSRLGSLDISQTQLGHEVSVQILAQQPKLQLAGPQSQLAELQSFVVPVQVLPRPEGQAAKDETRLPGSLAALPKPLFARVLLQGLNLADLSHLTHASRSLRAVSEEASSIFWDLRSLCCFHTRTRFDEDGCILGVGVAVTEEDGRNHLTCDFDPISKLAFHQLGVRKGVWKNKISYWLPLAIDAHHFHRATPSLIKVLQVLGTGKVAEQTRSFGRKPGGSEPPKSIQALSFDEWLESRAKKSEAAKAKFEAFRAGKLEEKVPEKVPIPTKPSFDAAVVLDVLPKLMNSQVVLLMKGETWASHKALSGYMGFHHLLLSICRDEPAVQAELEKRIENFMAAEEERVKSNVPNLGEFICLIAASMKHDWPSVAGPLLAEVFDRNVLWLLKKYPHLGQLSDVGVSKERLRATFEAALVSMRLIMFNAWFLNNVAKPPGEEQAPLLRYERTKGVAPRHQIEAVHRAVRRICEVNTWEAYFDSLGVKRIAPMQLCCWLRQSVLNSSRKGYHRPGRFQSRARPVRNDSAWDACDQMAEAWE